jgi:hypothetical protein
MGMMTFLPLGFLSGYGASWLLRKANLLRVPPEIEIEGLDLAEYGTLVQPEHGSVIEQVIEPDGSLTETHLALAADTNGAHSPAGPVPR